MKTKIIYSSRYGSTEKIANILKERINSDIEKLNENTVFDEYDLVILGCSARMGRLDKVMRSFIKNNKEKLLEKKYAFFLSSIDTETSKYFEESIDKEILESAIIYLGLGGEINKEKLKGLDKFIISLIAKKKPEIYNSKIDEDKIKVFVESLKN